MQCLSLAAFANWKGMSRGASLNCQFDTEIPILKKKLMLTSKETGEAMKESTAEEDDEMKRLKKEWEEAEMEVKEFER